MNDELLKLYSHPTIQSKRGGWQHGDRYMCKHSGTVVMTVTWIDNQFGEKEYLPCCFNQSIWLPPLYSDEQPERNLIFFVDGFDALKQYAIDSWVCITDKYQIEAKTPTEAVLGAIIAKEEI